MKRKKLCLFQRLFMLLISFMLFTVISACGRKGDPVLIIPDDKAAANSFIADNEESEGHK